MFLEGDKGPKPVWITSMQDSIDNDRSVIVSHTTTSAECATSNGCTNMVVKITDTDARGLKITAKEESDARISSIDASRHSYWVRLESEPTANADVSLEVVSHDPSVAG